MTEIVPARILVVEDEAVVALDIEERLRRLGYEVVSTADSAEAALAEAALLRPDLVLMDIQLGRDGSNGIGAARRLRAEHDIAVVFLTAFADPTTIESAKAATPHGYILKPFDERDLRTTIEIALHRNRLDRALRRSHDDLVAILDAQRAGVLLVGAAGQVRFANTAARRMLGRDPALGERNWADGLGLANGDRGRVQAVLQQPPGQRRKVSARLMREDGREWVVEIEIEDDPRDPAGRIFFVYDMSELYDLRQLVAEQGSFHDLVGHSQPMQDVVRLIRDVARVDATVLVLGETGTGKELVARAIHRESARCDGPFVAVNCAGLSEELAASQLFGHRRGAFTGAVSDSAGVFEAAHGGTLFLDEIGDLSLRVQTTLLRVLEERRLTRLGETQLRDVDVRIVVATNRDLIKDVAAGRFRADLLYRIRVGRIGLPPLRERREDLWFLVQHVLREHRAVTGRAVEGVSDEAMRALLAYDWPGNVRELKNAIGYAVIHCRGTAIELEDLPPEVLERPLPASQAGDLPTGERERIIAALQHTRGRTKGRGGAARHRPRHLVSQAHAVRTRLAAAPPRRAANRRRSRRRRGRHRRPCRRAHRSRRCRRSRRGRRSPGFRCEPDRRPPRRNTCPRMRGRRGRCFQRGCRGHWRRRAARRRAHRR
jgi:DNA-binding NtrC family response regulator